MSKIQKGEEIIELLEKAHQIISATSVTTKDYDDSYWKLIKQVELKLDGKLVVPSGCKVFSAEAWAEVNTTIKEIKGNPSYSLSFNIVDYRITVKQMDELERLLGKDGG